MENINELADALSKAQGEISGALKDTTNPFFKSKYADLESVWTAIRGPLTKNGLAVAQPTELINNILCVKTILMHKSGQSLSGIMPVKSKDDSAQAMGSAISYARRYALAAMIGTYQTDDDGNDAGKVNANESPKIIKGSIPGPSTPIMDATFAAQHGNSKAEGPTKAKSANEHKTKEINIGNKEEPAKNQLPITQEMLTALMTKLEIKGKGGSKFYDWIYKEYNTRFPANLKTWEYVEIMDILDGNR